MVNNVGRKDTTVGISCSELIRKSSLPNRYPDHEAKSSNIERVIGKRTNMQSDNVFSENVNSSKIKIIFLKKIYIKHLQLF